MHKTRVGEAIDAEKMPYVEMDPYRRYGRFKDLLGKGATKNVYKAFDEFLGMEVAWNQVKLNDVFRSPEELQRVYSEVHLLNNLNHNSIMRFLASWIDVETSTFNFITEMFTSGTLREYRKKFKRVNIRAIKEWSRQILKGLNYLHRHDPPVIHRDLKCDNIFVNGHLGQVRIGDLGLAAILHGSHHAHSVIGTPEFMAPELYEEDYDELVDIYSFGMCVLEMLTSEYPYSECSNPAQIYKKVTSGKLPKAFYQIDDVEAQKFVGRCLEKVPNRPSAHELLMDPFLVIEDVKVLPPSNFLSHQKAAPPKIPAKSTGMSITGTMNAEDDTIFLKVQISDNDGPGRNVYFPFDILCDTPLDVATEMVKELEITDWEPYEIADMIEEEISTLVPKWKDSSSHQICKHGNFTDAVDEDSDDNNLHHPFYSTSSSLSSSQASLPGLFPPHDAKFFGANSLHDWLNDEAEFLDDASSQGSSYSNNYINMKYYSATDDSDDLIPSSHERLHCLTKTIQCSRFCPEGSKAKVHNNLIGEDCWPKHSQRMVRTGSLVDIRSQLLHRTLVEEINKRRLFKTVGAVEHIGYHDPHKFSSGMTGFFQGKCIRESGTRRFNR